MKAKEIIEFMDSWAPEILAEDWDNVGFQIGDDSTEVTNILVTLDLDENIYEYALDNNINMIIAHHPFIFGGISSVNNKTYLGRIIINMIKNDKVFYAAHTNLDKAKDGVNEALGKVLDLKDSYVMDITEEDGRGYGRIGNVDDILATEYIDVIKSKLNVERLTVFGDIKDKYISKVAVMGGSGASYIQKAADCKADIIITGDIKYHDGQLADRLGIIAVDAGHFHTEKIVLPKIKEKLLALNKNLEVKIFEKSSPIYKIY